MEHILLHLRRHAPRLSGENQPKAPEAAEAMKVGASDLKKIGIVDEIITEPIGGAHQDYDSGFI